MTEKRIAVLNNEIYEISEGTFRIAMGFNRNPLKQPIYDKKKYQEMHEKNCNRIRKYGRLLMTADIMLRDD